MGMFVGGESCYWARDTMLEELVLSSLYFHYK
jgi:hypothetical protein